MSAQDDAIVTLDSVGNGSMTFNSGSTRIKKVIEKVTLLSRYGTTSGIVSLYNNSDLLGQGPLAATVTIDGEGYELLPGRTFKISIANGPANTVVAATVFHKREPV